MTHQDNGAIRAIHEGTTAGYRLGLFQYDVRNRLIEIEPNSAPGRTDHGFGYDAVSRVASVINDLPASASDLTIGLGYNAAGQIVTRTRSDADYVFDDPTPGETDYDPDGLNQYPTVDAPDSGLATLTYDARGNFVRYNAPGADHERIYVYDALNRLVSARLAGESVAQATLFSYDPLGRLYQVTDQAIPANSRRYLWDGSTIIAQYDDTSATVQQRWVYPGGGLGAPLIEYDGASVAQASRHYVSTDERGSVVSITNPDGTIEAINSYDPYGRPGDGNEGQFQYAGQLWLPEAGLYYMRNRMYDPGLGRFTQTDPIGYAGGMNLYGYVGNDPTNLADPLGLCASSERVLGSRVCQRYNENGPVYFGGHSGGSFPGPSAGVNTAAHNRAHGGSANPPEHSTYSNYTSITTYIGLINGSCKPVTCPLFTSTQYSYTSGPLAGLSFAVYGPGIGHNQGPPIGDNGVLDNPMVLVRPLSPIRYGHIRDRHFGRGDNASVFRPEWRSYSGVTELINYAIQHNSFVPGDRANTYTYSATFTDPVGWLRGSGDLTWNVTVVVLDTLIRSTAGLRVLGILTVHPGLPGQ